jgi:penicillin-binding protein 1A
MRLKIFLIIAVLITGFIAGGYLAVAKGVPAIEELKKYKATDGTKVYADDDTLIGEFKIEKGIFVPIKNIPDSLKHAVIAVEDARFYQHKGIDYLGIGRALIKDLMHASLKEGGSTITQQLAKIMFLTPEKTVQRKFKEAQLAIKLEKELTKDEILELYLNRAYFGHGAYGVEMASRTYFNKSTNQLTLPEAALLAGIVKAPNTYSPYNNLVRAKERQDIVLMRMEEVGYIKPSEREKARKQAITLSSLRTNAKANNYFIEYIRQQLEQKYGTEIVYKGSLKVYTTMNKAAQLYAQQALQEGLREVDKRRGWRGAIGKKDVKNNDDEDRVSFSASIGDISTGVVQNVTPTEAIIKTRGISGKLLLADAMWASTIIDEQNGKTQTLKNFKLTNILKKGDIIWVKFKSISGNKVTFFLEQEPEVEGALVAIEPETGFIRALVGGFSSTKSSFNRAALSKRQPGSAIKPIIFAAALENGYTPASVIIDEPVTYKWGGEQWKPENYDHKYYGPTRLREALAYSRNIITVKLLDAVGVDKVIAIAHDAGIDSEIPRELSIALGSISVTPLELARTYATFANGGLKMKPISIKYITDKSGAIIENNEPEGEEAISPQTAFLITSIMQDVITYGTGMRANIGRSAAGKTGTSNDYKDAWFVGYTPQLVGCVWVGFDDMRRSLGRGEVGGRASAPIWAHFMRNVLSGEPAETFAIAEGIVKLQIHPATGLLSYGNTSVFEYFKEGTQPVKYHEGPEKIDKPKEEINPNYD